MMEFLDRLARLIFGRGRVKYVDDSGPVQRAQVCLGPLEIVDNMPIPHDFGFTSNPPLESDVFACFLGSNRKNGLIVAVGSQQYRIKNLKTGEAAIYDSRGQSVYLTESGIVINGGGLPLTITNVAKARIESSLEVTGDIKDRCDTPGGKTMSAMRDTFNTHTHTDPQGGTVSVPNQQM